MEYHTSQAPDEYNYLKPGDAIPWFQGMDENGKSFSSLTLIGKACLIVLFTPECRYCRDNFAHLEKNLFSLNPTRFSTFAFGRDMDEQAVLLYKKRFSLSIPVLTDSKRDIYSKFAEKAVPRNYLFDSSGKLIMSIRGYRPDELERLIGYLNPGID